ncbi:MAG: leucyl aminopeptidase [Chloroflexota bacterium]|nr:leucyl aminopeptidase [Chloroflexota bacterium]
MEVQFSNESLANVQADTLLVGLLEGGTLPNELQERLGEAASDLLSDFEGKSGEEVAVFYPRGAVAARRLLLVGLGKEEELTLEALRRAAAKGVVKAKSFGGTVATTLAHQTGQGFDTAEATRAVVEAAELGLYDYSLKQKKGEDGPEKTVEILILLAADEAAQRAAALGQAVASGVTQARDLVNAPPNIADAPYLAEVARDIAGSSPYINAKILSLEETRAMGMGAFNGVAQGSATPPQFIVLEYRVDELPDQRPVGLAGKGLIFDTGGISIKPSTNLWKMKTDMAGGAAVLGLFRALANLPEPLDLPIVGVVPATDNAIGQGSFTPADVLTSLKGKTIEVQNTDAEGRLILADALTYIDRYNPRAVVDLATLTGAIVVALGNNMSGLFSNDEDLVEHLQLASHRSGEELWRMPLYDDYDKLLESDIADVKNVGGRAGSSITAALFLRNFIGDYEWAHLDIASTAWHDERKPKLPYAPKGASGVGVRLLMELLRGYEAKDRGN